MSFWNSTNEYNNNIAIITSERERYTYQQFFDDVKTISHKMNSTKKQLILILARNDYLSIVSYIAALQKGDAVMLVNAELEKELLYKVIDCYKPAFIVGNFIHNDYTNIGDNMSKRKIEENYDIYQDLALLLSTSGTTGSIKFVRLSYKNLVSNASSIANYLHITSEDRGLANLPMHYSYGLSIINSHLYMGATILLTDESVLTKSFWEFMKDEKATSLAGVPYTYQMLHRIGFHKMDLPYLRYFTQAGGRLNEKLVRLFGEYAQETGKKFYVMYGQTEATARISYVPPEKLLEKPTSIGKAIPNGELMIDQETSELIYKGPNVMLGYATSFQDLAKGDELQGRLRTGDLAEVDEDGFFYIKGRMKRFIKLFGLRLNLDEIEKQLESTLHTPIVCVGTDDKMIVVTNEEKHVRNVQSTIEHLYKLHRSAFRVQVMEEIPRLANGKVNYERIKDLIL
ncbi:AMP-binding protein [Thermaerobacillus caldiproteolyticus]|uniref:AMP-binding protein n=1 Tax=Thermaerobacillus caldiproteolyticus TaxID=247480 RepID=UPI00188CAAF7|nr:AMP-binding protein [Anoxybacillus caldiproteolyticus]QPA30695.1 AMP-binding protein [Anoxybacillus caldiproteolyticus]